jgi:hypothetical protein
MGAVCFFPEIFASLIFENGVYYNCKSKMGTAKPSSFIKYMSNIKNDFMCLGEN